MTGVVDFFAGWALRVVAKHSVYVVHAIETHVAAVQNKLAERGRDADLFGTGRSVLPYSIG